MNVDRHVKLCRGGKQAVKARVIEEAAFGRAIDHCTDEAEFFDRTLELDRGCVRTLQGQTGEAGEAVGVARDCRSQMIVELTGERDTVGAGKQIRAWAAIGKHLHGDAGLVH